MNHYNLNTPMPTQLRDRVFVSYSHKDKEWLDKFSAVLAPDIRNGRVDYWDDRELQPGDPWYAKILEGINAARVAVLLVSPNFLASRFIMEEELPRICSARDNGLTIVWIPLYGAFYGPEAPPQIKPLTDVQAAFDAGKPLAEQDPASQTARLLDLCHHIQRLLNPGRIPSNLPFNSLAELFKGRNEALTQLDRSLRQHGSAAIVQPQAIHGLGGIGKTRLAIEYAWRHQDDFTAFLFVSSNTPADLDRNLAALCRPDCLDLREALSPLEQEQRDAVVRWLQQNKDWLLILDNVDTDEGVRAVKALVSKLRGGHVLITSRVTEWGRGVRPLALDVLPLDDAAALLLESAQTWREPRSEDVTQARTLADRLGRLPLALTHAAAYMQHHHQGFVAYLDDFERHFGRLLAYHDHLAIEYETELEMEGKEAPSQDAMANRRQLLKTVATTFFLSFDRLAPEAKAILQSAAFLAPDPIPAAMYEQCPNETEALVNLWCEESSVAKTGQTFADALAALNRYSLISRGDGLFSVHRIEQRVLRSRIAKERMPLWHERTQKLLYKYAPEETAESPRTWIIWDALRPHAEFLVKAFVSDDSLPPHLDLMGSLGSLLFGKGLYGPSLQVEEDALKVAERSSGAESKAMADKLLNYGESLRVLDREKEALQAFQRSLEIREKLDGKDSLRVASALNYVGLAHDGLNNAKDAESCYRRAISIFESHGDKADKDDLAKPLNNLAVIVRAAGNHNEAEKLLLKAVELSADDEKHKVKPQLTIICRVQLASLLVAEREFGRAEQYYKDAVDRLSVFPEDHPFREGILEQYSMFLCRIHKLAEAKRLFSSAVSVNRPKWGSEEREQQPERRLRSKMRILETKAFLEFGGKATEHRESQLPELLHELAVADWKPWEPALMYGMWIKDKQEMDNFNFLFKKGEDDVAPNREHYEYQNLMRFYLTSVAVDEANQWATADGEMPNELKDTTLGAELAQQARSLGRLVSCALNPNSTTGKAFCDDLSLVTGNPLNVLHECFLELWVKPTGAKVYHGEPVGDLLRVGREGDNVAILLEASLEVFWEWHMITAWRRDSINTEELYDCLNRTFESHILPLINRALNEGRLLARLRQINYCMFLATWFKEKFRYHPNIAKYLESGKSDQLSPTILNIAAVAGKTADGERREDVTFNAADWGRGKELNNKALESRKQGRSEEAEALSRESLRFDENLRGPLDPIIPNRLQNLSIALIMQSKLDEAKGLLSNAWQLKSGQHDLTSTRLLFVRLTVALLKAQPIEEFVGQLKTLIAAKTLPDYADVHKVWDIDHLIEYLKPKLDEHNAGFLTVLVTALNDRAKLSDLDSFPEWRNQQPVSLDTPWP